MDFVFNKDYEDFHVQFMVTEFFGGREPVYTQNPDSPHYEDQGDPPEFNVESVLFQYTEGEEVIHSIPVPSAFANYLIDLYSQYIIEEGIKRLKD